MLILQSPAKINLVLEIISKRDDGYHEIKSIMQTIGLYDMIRFEEAQDLELNCTVSQLQTDNNLVMKAAQLLRQVSGCKKGSRIKLDKRIPWSAGLGGGSSNAAITLIGLNRMWGLNYPERELADIGSRIGSDIPFFIYGGTCLAEGRGEKISPLPDIVPEWFVFIKPDIPDQANKTTRLYGMMQPANYTEGTHATGMQALIESGGRLTSASLYNAFDYVVFKAYPELVRYWGPFHRSGAGKLHLAGSGPAIFTLAEDEAKANEIKQKLAEQGITSIVVPSAKRGSI
ncbi:MAG: 4-(cytidine 5'-diphospho)-2-C-methyl-D-erythritol kinase [Dehalococcoidia bacterium]|nr:4-(cytidine 5'-diphospho)-2-C-methyl-D-erythritol kinase [Dehalococcoidia bacterium]